MEIAGHTEAHMTERELRDISMRLARYHGIELFRILRAIPGERYFPPGVEIERRVRVALGKDPMKGLSHDAIDRNTEELVKSGQPREKAEKGAAFLKKVMASRAQAPSPTLDKRPMIMAASDALLFGAGAVEITEDGARHIPFNEIPFDDDGFEEIEIPKQNSLDSLEDFDS